jgi:hypothetical protein
MSNPESESEPSIQNADQRLEEEKLSHPESRTTNKKPKEKETIDSRTQDKRKMGHRFRVVYQSSR